MLWFFLSILVALFDTIKNLISKYTLKHANEYIVTWVMMAVTALCSFLLVSLTGFPSVDRTFWIVLVLDGTLNAIAFTLFMRAVKLSDLSLSVPLLSLSPLFLLITSPLIVGEFPNWLGLLGVVFIVIGAYTLQISERHNGYLAPFTALLKKQGPRIMIIVAAIWSITSVLDKIGIQHSSPLLWPLATSTFIALALFPIVIFHAKKNLGQIRKRFVPLILVGLSFVGVVVLQMIAISLTLVVYVSAIKRFAVVLTVLCGSIFFKEQGFKERLLGASLMCLGLVAIVFSQLI